MIKKLKVHLYLILAAACLNACSAANNKPLSVGFSADSSKILVANIDDAGLHQLHAMGDLDSLRTPLLTVMDTPGDDDTTGREQQVPGKISLVEDVLEFSPDQPFKPGKQYLVITYLNVRFGNLQSALQGTLRNGVRPNQKLLRR